MPVDREMVKKVRAHARRARERITSARRMPGTSEFRKAWFETGPSDLDQAIELWEARYEERAKVRRQLSGEQELSDRMAQLGEDGDLPEPARHEDQPFLHETFERARADVHAVEKELADEQGRHDQELEEDERRLDRLKAERDDLLGECSSARDWLARSEERIAELRSALEDLQGMAARLQPLITQTQRRYGLTPSDTTDHDGSN